MTNAKFIRQIKRISAFAVAASGFISALAGVASAAQHYAHVVFTSEAICGSDHSVLQSLESNTKQIAASPAHLIDLSLWNRPEVDEEHKNIGFSELLKTDPEAHGLYLDLWWQEVTRVENCLGEFKRAYEESPGYLKLAYPPRTRQKMRIAQNVLNHLQMIN